MIVSSDSGGDGGGGWWYATLGQTHQVVSKVVMTAWTAHRVMPWAMPGLGL